MDTSRISFGEMVAGVSAVALLIFMFFPWYGVDIEGFGGDITGAPSSAWQWFGFIDVLLFLVALIAIGMAVARATESMPTGLPAPPGLIVASAGAFAVLLILFRLLSPPDPSFTGDAVDLTRKFGIFLGLIAAGGITFGGYTAMNERSGGHAAAPAAGPAGPGPGGPGPGGPGPAA